MRKINRIILTYNIVFDLIENLKRPMWQRNNMKDFLEKVKASKVDAEIKVERLDELGQEQFLNILYHKDTKYASLQADAHGGYIAPIGTVILTEKTVVPQYVGYDIGCGLCAYKTPFTKNDLMSIEDKKEIHKLIYEAVPTGMKKHKEKQYLDIDLPLSDLAVEIVESIGLYQLGTLGGGNHFMEIGYSDVDSSVWIIIHSGSRGVGAKIAQYYITAAFKESCDYNEKSYHEVYDEFSESIGLKFEENHKNFKAHNPIAFKKAKSAHVNKEVKIKYDAIVKANQVPSDKLKEIYPLDEESKLGQEYIKDLAYSLEFAIENRKHMASAILDSMNKVLGTNHEFNPIGEEDSENDEEVNYINRNHNHAEHSTEFGGWIHRKGATHANLGMLGVIPGNMRDGSFIVRGLGNPKTLNSSSHGAGRVLSRAKAKKVIKLEEFKDKMKEVVGTVNVNTLDEAPDAYKNIFDVMAAQKDCVDTLERIIPLINVKDDTPSKY